MGSPGPTGPCVVGPAPAWWPQWVLSVEAGRSVWGPHTRPSSAQGSRNKLEGVFRVWASGAKRGEEVPCDSGRSGHTLTSDFLSLSAEEEAGDLVQPGISFPGPAEEDLGRAPGPAPVTHGGRPRLWGVARPLPGCNRDPSCPHAPACA